jgi:GAF domain-containing protein
MVHDDDSTGRSETQARRETERQAAVDVARLDDFDATAYDDLARAAASLFETPVALVTVVDRDEQRFLGKVGTDLTGTPRAIAFCDAAVAEPGRVHVVEDASTDPRYADNPLVTGDLHIRFYAGAPLVSLDGHALGTLCVLDTQPRKVDPGKIDELRFLAEQVMRTVRSRRSGGG